MKTIPRLRIVLADDHALVRAGIRALLENMPNVEIVGEAGDGLEALETIQRMSPDIALLDLAMPKMGGISVTEQLAARSSKVRVLMLSMHCHAVCVTDAFRAGAVGYLAKDSAASELATAIQAVANGDSYVSPVVCRAVLPSALRHGMSQATAEKEPLTPRQLQVLRLIAEGQTTKEAAYTLGISSKTVEVHRSQLMERLGIHDVPGLVRYAMRIGIVPSEP